jgi:uncharacterized membrane protein
MPSVVSPAQVQTANGENMYVPIDGDIALLPPIIEGTPITSEPMGFPPFISSITGTEPITINENVRIDYTSSINYSFLSTNMSTIYVSSFLSTPALTVNGPVRLSYATNPAISTINALDISGTMMFKTISANMLEALKIFNIPVSFVDYALSANDYGFGNFNVFDMGGLRFVTGTTNLGIPYDPSNPNNPTFILRFNDIPANTIPNQTQTGFFIGKPNCITSFTQGTEYRGEGLLLFGANTQQDPGNVRIYTNQVVIVAPPERTRYTFVAIGVAKT